MSFWRSETAPLKIAFFRHGAGTVNDPFGPVDGLGVIGHGYDFEDVISSAELMDKINIRSVDSFLFPTLLQ